MEILKSISYLQMMFLLLMSTSVAGQDFTATKEAFQSSYIDEATGDYYSAINSLKAVYDEKSYETNLRLGWLSYLGGNFTESIAYYNKAINLMPYSVEPRFGIVYPSSAVGNWSTVIREYEKILEICPNNSYALHRLGLVYYGREDYGTAKKYFDKVVNLYPFDYDALTMLGWTNLKLSNLREARVLFQKALLHTPTGASAAQGLDLIKTP